MNRPLSAVALAACSLALAACSPDGSTPAPATRTTTPSTAPTPAATPTGMASATAAPATSAPTAPPSQAAAGSTSAQAAADALADERRLLTYDLLAEGPGSAAAARRLTQADPDVAGADAALTLDAAGVKALADRRAAQRTALVTRLDAEAATGTALADALAKATPASRAAGGTIRTGQVSATVGGVAWTLKAVRAANAAGVGVFGLVRATAPGRVIVRSWAATATGGQKVTFTRDVTTDGTAYKAAWTATLAADGAFTGGGVVSVRGENGPKSLIATLKGTAAAPQLTLADPAARLSAEVVMPLSGALTATLIRQDADGARVPVPVTAE